MQQLTGSRGAGLIAFVAVIAFGAPAFAMTGSGGAGLGDMPSQRIVNNSTGAPVARAEGRRGGDLSAGLVRTGRPRHVGTAMANSGGGAAGPGGLRGSAGTGTRR